MNIVHYSRTRIKETFGYQKRFHSSAFMLSTLVGQLMKETLFLPPYEFFYLSLTVLDFP